MSHVGHRSVGFAWLTLKESQGLPFYESKARSLKNMFIYKNFVCIYKEIARNVHWSINMALTNYSFGILVRETRAKMCDRLHKQKKAV